MIATKFNMDLFYVHNVDEKSPSQKKKKKNIAQLPVYKGQKLANYLFLDIYVIKLKISMGTCNANFRIAG